MLFFAGAQKSSTLLTLVHLWRVTCWMRWRLHDIQSLSTSVEVASRAALEAEGQGMEGDKTELYLLNTETRSYIHVCGMDET